MKFKIGWAAGIVIALVSFMVFILSYVYKVMFLPQYDHHLVSEEYYKDELNYQKEIDEENNGVALKENIKISKDSLGLTITFPSEFEPSKITGTISFMRLSNDKIDFSIPIKLTSNQLLVKDDVLVEGRWDIKIEWIADENTYLYKEKIMY